MTRPEADFVRYVQQLAREAEAGLRSHPEPETLLAYYRDELDEAAAEAVAEHVTLCRSCADLLLAIPSFLAEDAPAPEAPVAREAPTPPPAPGPTGSPRLRDGGTRRWLPWAAALLVGVGLGHLTTRPAAPPALATFRVGVLEGDAPGARSGSEVELELAFQPGQAVALAVLTPKEPLGPGPFRARIRDGAGRVWLDEPDLQPTALGTFVLSVARGALPPDELEVEIAASGPQGAPVGRWLLHVLPEP